jgi:PIN domain nuclease of toxin-antitoxin system
VPSCLGGRFFIHLQKLKEVSNMPEYISEQEKHSFLFIQLIAMLETAAMQHLGKLPNPMTNKVEKNLEQARMTIDLIDMLKAKTQGNLNDDEKRFLTKIVSDLQLNYVDEFEKSKKQTQEKKET